MKNTTLPVVSIISTIVLISISLFNYSCKKDDPVPEPDNTQPSNTTITTNYYFSATIDGQSILFQDGVNGYGSGTGSGATSTNQEEQIMVFMQAGGTTNIGGISIINKFVNDTICSDIESMFSIGTYNYGNGNTEVDGALVYYVDNVGVQWSSDNGTAVQTNSTFELIEHISNTDGFSERISKISFSCILYDGNGNSKVVTSGEIRGRSVNCWF